MLKRQIQILIFFLFLVQLASGQVVANYYTLFEPDQVFDGERAHKNWAVLIKNENIEAVGLKSDLSIPEQTQVITLKGCTLLPGLIEGHAHLFLHPYNETSWNDQVLLESRAERTARAINHAKATLLAGFTTVRDLGTEGAMYDDVGLKQALEKGVVEGPDMIVATRAIVATGSYGVFSKNPELTYPKGAAEVANVDEMAREVRLQISKGADLIKIYADYRWGKNGESAPTFTAEEMAVAVKIAHSGNREVVVHAATEEGMRRAIEAGVNTIEHGGEGSRSTFEQMKAKGIAYCPTLAAGEAIASYAGWRKGIDPEPDNIKSRKENFQLALSIGVPICMGGDVGVFSHGDNAREMELMVAYGMPTVEVLRSATSLNADVFGYGDRIGRVKKGLLANLIIVQGNPTTNIQDIRKVQLVVKKGKLIHPTTQVDLSKNDK